MKTETKEMIQTGGAVAALVYMVVPQARKFVNEQTEKLFGGTSEGDDSTSEEEEAIE